mmetsp:Transcript_30851/g.90523  ORF Transcript_30851/g.90523 Transcript_30851/m.90523 type:complete len:246 (+) Transcript_30851:1719-2456(+)
MKQSVATDRAATLLHIATARLFSARTSRAIFTARRFASRLWRHIFLSSERFSSSCSSCLLSAHGWHLHTDCSTPSSKYPIVAMSITPKASNLWKQMPFLGPRGSLSSGKSFMDLLSIMDLLTEVQNVERQSLEATALQMAAKVRHPSPNWMPIALRRGRRARSTTRSREESPAPPRLGGASCSSWPSRRFVSCSTRSLWSSIWFSWRWLVQAHSHLSSIGHTCTARAFGMTMRIRGIAKQRRLKP